jgi:flagellar hook-basal body complex protein FliE
MSISGVKSFEALSSTFSEMDKIKDEGNKNLTPFAEYFKEALAKTNNLIVESDRLAGEFAAGRTDNIHQVLIAAEKAELALQYTMQIRNKILDAYNEIMRMQI